MISTNGDFVSEIRNHLKALNKDDQVSARYILSIAYSYIEYLINTRPLSKTFRDNSVFTVAECVPLKRVDSKSCDIIEFRLCEKIMKSVHPLPKILTANSGFIVDSVLSLDGGVHYEPLRSLKDYKNTIKRPFGNKFKYYYIDGSNYIYLLNSTSERIDINALFTDEDEVKQISDCVESDECFSKLDNKFVCPKEFLSTVRDQTLQVILGGNKQIVQDENPNMDNNVKQRTR